jgi:hypothetical protein
MWQQKNRYYIQNGTSTICKVTLNKILTYELWHEGRQYAGFKTVDEAKLKHRELIK